MFKTTNKLLTALTFGIFLVSGSSLFANYEKCASACMNSAVKCMDKCHDDPNDLFCVPLCALENQQCLMDCEAQFPNDYTALKKKLSQTKK